MNYSMQGLSGSTAQANAVPRAPTLQSSIEDFDPVLGRLETLLTRTSNCADRIVGSRPSEVASNPKDAPSPPHLLFAVSERRARLVRMVDFLENEIGRIESGLA